jgi:hypothetical protein
MRVLVVSTSGAGHITPLVPLIDAFADAGDEVLVMSSRPRCGPSRAPRCSYATASNVSAAEIAAMADASEVAASLREWVVRR